MHNPTSILTPNRRVRIFLSSRIGEFASERKALVKRIKDAGFEPVFFESHARPHPPKEMYTSYLEHSDIFLGIYGIGYGWIDTKGGMTISGIHDEWNLSKGKPQLVLIKDASGTRDPALDALLKEIENAGTTCYYHYKTKRELLQIAMDSIAIAITERYLSRLPVATAVGEEKAEKIRSTIPPGMAITTTFWKKLRSIVLSKSKVYVWGGYGTGKSEALISLSDLDRSVYISARNRSPFAVLSHIANQLNLQASSPSETFGSPESAHLRIEQRAAELDATMLVDDCDEADGFVDLLMSLKVGKSRIVAAGRREMVFSGADVTTLICDGFSDGDVKALFDVAAAHIPTPTRDEAHRKSLGNPLYLRYFIANAGLPAASLNAYHESIWGQLRSESQELVSAIALSEVRVQLKEIALFFANYSGRRVTEIGALKECEEISHAVRVRLGEVELFHPAFRQYVLERLNKAGLAKSIHEAWAQSLPSPNDRSIAVYHKVKAGTGDEVYGEIIDAASWADLAGRRSMERDLIAGQLRLSRTKNDAVTIGRSLYACAMLAQHTQSAKCALRLVVLAEKVLARVGRTEWVHIAQTARATFLVEMGRGEEATNLLGRLKRRYERIGLKFEEALVRVNLSFVYVKLGRFTACVREASVALKIFSKLNDLRGAAVASMNLNNAYYAIGDFQTSDKELSRLQSLAKRLKSPRMEAAVLNCMTIRLRKAKKFAEAKEACRRAISIGETLNEWDLVAINSLNLGNVFRDEMDHAEARQWYDRCIDIGRSHSSPAQVAAGKHVLAEIEDDEGNLQKAIGLEKESLDIWRRLGNTFEVGKTAADLASRLARSGELGEAAKSFQEATVGYLLAGMPTDAVHVCKASIYAIKGKFEPALHFIVELTELAMRADSDLLNGFVIAIAMCIEQLPEAALFAPELDKALDKIGQLDPRLSYRGERGADIWTVAFPYKTEPAVELMRTSDVPSVRAATAIMAMLLFAGRQSVVADLKQYGWHELGLTLGVLDCREGEKMGLRWEGEIPLERPAVFSESAVDVNEPQPAMPVLVSDKYLEAADWSVYPQSKSSIWLMISLYDVVAQHFTRRRYPKEITKGRRHFVHRLFGVTHPDDSSTA